MPQLKMEQQQTTASAPRAEDQSPEVNRSPKLKEFIQSVQKDAAAPNAPNVEPSTPADRPETKASPIDIDKIMENKEATRVLLQLLFS